MKTGSGSGGKVIIGSWGGSGNELGSTFLVPSKTLGWDTGQQIVNDRWYHIAMTYGSSFNVKVYLDGQLLSSRTSANPLDFFGQTCIGRYAIIIARCIFGGLLMRLWCLIGPCQQTKLKTCIIVSRQAIQSQ
jgi:hypothetical protein